MIQHQYGLLCASMKSPMEATEPRAHRMDGSSCLTCVSYTPAL